jgi:hypothetical protein
MRYNKVYVTHCDEGFIPYVQNLVKSVTEFSDIPIIVYLIDSDKTIKGNNVIVEHIKTSNDHRSEYEKQEDGTNRISYRGNNKIFELYFQKPKSIKHALENYADNVVYLDGDSIATPYIDNLFNYGHKYSKYPLSNIARMGVMMWKGKGNPWKGDYDITKCLEYKACQILDADINNRVNKKTRRLTYTQTGYIASNINHIWFYEEWIDSCYRKEFENNKIEYMPFHEETIYNVLRWKYNFTDTLPYCYVEMSIDKSKQLEENIKDKNSYQVDKLNNVFFNFDYDIEESIIQRKTNYATSGNKNDICVLHGKTLETYETIMDFLRKLVPKTITPIDKKPTNFQDNVNQ